MNGRISRRRMLGAGAAALAAPYVVTVRLRGAEAPSNRITVGFIGTGSHGLGHNLSRYLQQPDARVLAVCDVDANRARQAKERVDARYGNTDCAVTGDFREILARKDIDAVMISTPDHWHTLMSVMAVRAGKDVQCEKPTLTIDEGRILVREVRRHGRVFQTSTEDRSLGVYRRMVELVRNGRIGKVRRVEVILPRQPEVPGDPTPQPVPPELDYDMWLGPAPEAPYTKDRVHYTFRWIRDYSGGILCDWGTHLFDTVQYALDVEHGGPVEVEGTGTFWSGGLFNTLKDYDLTYRYADGVVMTCKPGTPSLRFIGTDGWVGNEGWDAPLKADPPELLETRIGPEEFHVTANPAGEHRDFLDCVRSRKDPYFPVDIGHRVSTVCHMGNIAIQTGRRLRWDPRAEVFIGDDEANAMCGLRPMRKPWSLD